MPELQGHEKARMQVQPVDQEDWRKAQVQVLRDRVGADKMTIDCNKCPDGRGCCGIMIFQKEFIEKFKDKMQGKPERTIEQGNSITYIYQDCRCPFLDRINLKCVIYEDRPMICRIYGTGKDPRILCPYFKPNGNPWSEAKRKQLERIRDRMISRTLKETEKCQGK
jgi:hypothetical protein